MRIIITILGITLLCIPRVQSDDKSPTLEDMTTSVVFLRQDVVRTADVMGTKYEVWLKAPQNNEFTPQYDTFTGTGFLIGVNNHPYLVTASHVAAKMTPSAIAVVKGDQDNPIQIRLSDISRNSESLDWITHEAADVAVLPVFPHNSEVVKELEQHFLPDGILLKEHAAPSRETSLLILGFPLNLGVEGKFSPISKNSLPASGLLVLPRFDTQQPASFYLLEDPSIGGFSGAPVFDMPGTKMRGGAILFQRGLSCLGLVHGTMSDNTGGKLAAITPSIFVWETLTRAEQKFWPPSKGEAGQQSGAAYPPQGVGSADP